MNPAQARGKAALAALPSVSLGGSRSIQLSYRGRVGDYDSASLPSPSKPYSAASSSVSAGPSPWGRKTRLARLLHPEGDARTCHDEGELRSRKTVAGLRVRRVFHPV